MFVTAVAGTFIAGATRKNALVGNCMTGPLQVSIRRGLYTISYRGASHPLVPTPSPYQQRYSVVARLRDSYRIMTIVPEVYLNGTCQIPLYT